MNRGNTGVTPEINPDNCRLLFVDDLDASLGGIIAYPNTARDQVTIEREKWGENLITLEDAGGKVVMAVSADDTYELKLENLPGGFYFLLIEEDGQGFSHKFVVAGPRTL